MQPRLQLILALVVGLLAGPAFAQDDFTLLGVDNGAVIASGGTFDPSSVNPGIWVDPRTGVSNTGNVLNSITNQGSIGGTLLPASPTANSYTAADAKANNLPTISTPGPNGYLISGNVSSLAASTRVIVMAVRMNTFGAANNVVFAVGPGGFSTGWGVDLPGITAGLVVSGDVYGWGNGEPLFTTSAPQVTVGSGGASADTVNYHIYGLILSSTGGNQVVEVDGVNKAPLSNNISGTALAAVSLQPLNIGVLPGSGNYDVSVAQIIVADDNVTPLTTLHNLARWESCKLQLNYAGGGPSACP